MSYLGRVTNKSSDIRRIDITSSTSATHTLTWTAPNEQSLIVTINGVKQQNNYTVSGTTLTLDTALISTDKLEVIGINDIGTTITPAQNSITNDMVSSSAAIAQSKLATLAIDTAELTDDAVTAAKLANSINTEIAANTAKVTNATHTGDVTGATALTIAADAVDIAMLSATGTADATTFLRGDNAWAAVASGLGTASLWYLDTNVDMVASTNTFITANLSEQGRVGSAMTESSGVFTFPSTGIWLISFRTEFDENATAYGEGRIWTTVNDATYVQRAYQRGSTSGNDGNYEWGNTNTAYVFDVTDVANCKAKFSLWASTTVTFSSSGYANALGRTYMIFERWGDT